MMYLQFEKSLMTNLQDALPKEIIRTNRRGGYSSSTIVDCNTRKYHGLLVVPIPEMGFKPHVLLSSLDETVIQHGAEFNLGLHRYAGGVYSPNGHKYIREYTWDKIPTTIYRVGGVVLKKELIFQHFHDRILIRYTLVDAHSATTLRLKPYLAYRAIDQLTHENSAASRDYTVIDNGIKTCMYEGLPDLHMQVNKKNEFVFIPNWYKGIEYQREQELGYEYQEDLYVPGYFEMSIKKGESVIFAAGLEQVSTRTLKRTFDEEVALHKPRSGFTECLTSAAHQFHYERYGEHYIIAGYPWFKCRARDMFIALPGLTLAIDEVDRYKEVMKTATKGIAEFMEGKALSVRIHEMGSPDVLLWAVWCIQQFSRLVSRDEALKLYTPLVGKIVQFIKDGKHPNLFLHSNGLLCTNGRDVPATWMNSMVNGKPAVPRSGYVVEINALWYNALECYAHMLEFQNKNKEAEQYHKMAKLTGESFKKVHLNQHGYLLDYVDGDHISWSVRPNMLICTALENSPLSKTEKKKIFDICTKELRTPKGIRSLSPKSGGYNPIFEGNLAERDAAYHHGTVWPWLLGFYLETCMKIYGKSGLSFVDRSLVGLEEEMFYHCLGTLPELFDGNPPFHGRGALTYAMNVAAILRVNKTLTKLYNY